MTTEEILAAFPLLKKGKYILYEIEKKGLISPTRRRRGTRKKRAYSAADLRKIALVIRYCSEGYGLQEAIEQAKSGERSRSQTAEVGPSLVSLLREVRSASWTNFWGDVAHQTCALAKVECVAVYLSPTLMIPVAAYHYLKQGIEPKHVSPLPASVHAENATQGVEQKIANLSVEELYVRGPQTAASHLLSGKYCSLLLVPFRLFKSVTVGWLVMQNKLDPNGNPGIGGVFDRNDELLAVDLGEYVAELADQVSESQASRILSQGIQEALPLGEFLDRFLETAIEMTGADRGEVTWWDSEQREGIVLVHRGERDAGPLPGQAMPAHSVTRQVMESGTSLVIDDVTDYKGESYMSCWKETLSELAVPLVVPPSPVLAVLNLESKRKRCFTPHLKRQVESLTRQASLYASVVDSKELILRLIRSSPQHRSQAAPEDRRHVGLEHIVNEAREAYELEGGIIYLADYYKGSLRCAAFSGAKDPINPYEFSYGFNERSLATKVFREHSHYFSNDPWHDTCFSPRGLEVFNIKGPVIGLPLMFGQTVVGVMVVWGRTGGNLSSSDVDGISLYGQLVVTAMGVTQAEQHQACMLDEIRALLVDLQQGRYNETFPSSILHSIIASGFERVRVFKVDTDGQVFVCLDSLGIEPNGAYCGITIPFENFYAERTRTMSPIECRAVIRNPQETGQEDPDAARVGKPVGLQWAMAPLFLGRSLYGYIAADNKRSNRPITQRNLNSLTLYASLAAQAIWRSRNSSAMEVPYPAP